jgi:hypothetical protein
VVDLFMDDSLSASSQSSVEPLQINRLTRGAIHDTMIAPRHSVYAKCSRAES